VETIGMIGYPGIVILMAVESSFIPFPSEIIMIPAGYLARQGEMNMGIAILCGTLGSILGALVNYAIAATLGRSLLLRHGNWFLLSREHFERAEKFLRTHGDIGTFVGRIIPVIRQYISFPAGVVRMPLRRFVLWTGLGAGLWVTVLALIGFAVGGNETLVKEWTQTATFWAVGACLVLIFLYVKWRKWMKKRSAHLVP